jgi:hypothetical protein
MTITYGEKTQDILNSVPAWKYQGENVFLDSKYLQAIK